MPNFISEDQIERALVQKLQQLYGFDTLNCYTEDPEDLRDGSGRTQRFPIERKSQSNGGGCAGVLALC